MSDARGKSYGPAVVDGVVQYTSPSALTTADPNQYGGCLLRYWWKYVKGMKEPFTGAQKAGVDVHSQVEGYLRTGEMRLGRIALAGLQYIPRPPLEGALIEHPIDDGRLTAAGIRVVGYADLFLPWSPTFIDTDGEHRANPSRTVEAIDWKTTGKPLESLANGRALLNTIQMTAYGKWAMKAFPAAEHARLSHVYFSTKGAAEARKTTVCASREEIDRGWNSAESVARTIIDAAKELDPSKVEANTRSCGAYRGCPHKSYCPAGENAKLEQIFGGTTMTNLMQGFNFPGSPAAAPSVAASVPPIPGVVVGIDNIAAHYAQQATGPVVTGIAPPAGVGIQIDLAGEIARLQALEAAQKAAAVQAPPAAVPLAGIPVGFAEALNFIEASKLGMPTFTHGAAQAVGTVKGFEVNAGAGLQGWGPIAGTQIADPAQVLELAAEIKRGLTEQAAAEVAAAAAKAAMTGPVAVLPPDAPKSNPALAALPVEGFVPTTPAAAAAVAAVTPTITDCTVESAGSAPKKRGRKSNEERAAIAAAQPAPSAAQAMQGQSAVLNALAPHDRGAAPASSGLSVYVNALPSCEFESLDGFVDDLCSKLCTEYGAVDVRSAPTDGPLGYAKWKGILHAYVKTIYQRAPFAGTFVLLVTDERSQVVGDALREICKASGGLFVSGTGGRL